MCSSGLLTEPLSTRLRQTGDFPVGDNFHYHLNGSSSQDSGRSSLGCTCSVAFSVMSGIHFNGFSGISIVLSLPGASFSFFFCTPVLRSGQDPLAWVSSACAAYPLQMERCHRCTLLQFSAGLGSSSSSGLHPFQMVSRTQPKELLHCVSRACPVIFVDSDQDGLTHVTAHRTAQKKLGAC